jgi:hypothetical protein
MLVVLRGERRYAYGATFQVLSWEVERFDGMAKTALGRDA